MAPVEVHKGRHGYYPCSRETFLKLKRIAKAYTHARRMLHDWYRWQRKQPQNRVIRKTIRDAQGRKVGSEVIGPRPEPFLKLLFIQWDRISYRKPATWYLCDHEFFYDYLNARHPCSRVEDVIPLKANNVRIDEMIAKIESTR